MDPTARLNSALAGRYAVERTLGVGGMATVYLARDLRHDRPVAIKVLKPELAAVLGIERFLAEIKVTANLQHPNLLALFDSGEAEALLFYVMPYVDGESLRARLTREKQMPIEDAIALVSAVGNALEYAHERGVVHRDLKPENILLHAGQPVVADFGIALAVTHAGGARITQTGLSLGTPHYMSPEQAMGDRAVDARSDIYSLGAVLYEMLTGEPPHLGSTPQAVVTRLLTERPRNVRSTRANVPEHVEAAIERALEKLPADRFSNVGQFVAALRGAGAAQRHRWPMLRAARRAIAGRRGVRRTIGAAAVVAAVALGYLWSAAVRATPTEWEGDLLGGPLAAYYPRVSPDGQNVAFSSIIDGQSQLVILKPATGDWAVLTADRTRGLTEFFAWARDGSRIYFSRFFQVPRGVFSVSPLGGDERLILEDAGNPDVLPDGSLLVMRINSDRQQQLFRYWPSSGQLKALGAIGSPRFGLFYRSFPDGREAVFYGRPVSDTAASDHLHAVDLESGEVRKLAPDLAIPPPVWVFPIAVTPDNKSVLIDLPSGNLHRIVSLPRNGGSRATPLVTLNVWPQGMDMGPDGSLYVDQVAQPMEILHYSPADKRLERQRIQSADSPALPLPDGRVLVAQRVAGRARVMTLIAGKQPSRFLDSDEETTWPMTVVGSDRVALIVGSSPRRAVTLVSIATGRIVAQLPSIPAEDLQSLAGSGDGKTVYFVTKGAVWAAPVAGGAPVRIHAGDGVAPDPNGRYLVIKLTEKDTVRLIRVSPTGADEQPIAIRGPLRLSFDLLAPNAVARDGRIAVRVTSPASWFFAAAILDPATGRLDPVPPGMTLDMFAPGWSSDGRVVTQATSIEASLWRLRPRPR